MTEQEQKDIDELKKAVDAKKISTFNYLGAIEQADERHLLTAGYGGKTNAEAMRIIFVAAKKELKRLMDAHLKKYPD